MGMKLVGLVIAKWAPYVPDRAYRVLTRMAFSALDEPSGKTAACMYTGGRDLLIDVMPNKEKRNLVALNQAIKRSINELIKLGAIEAANRACPGKQATYRLTLDGPIRIDAHRGKPKIMGVTYCPEQGSPTDPQNPEWGSPSAQNGGHLLTPLGELRITPTGEQVEEIGVDLRRPVTLPRDAGKETTVEKKCDNDDCEFGYRYDASKPKGQRNTRCPDCRPTTVIPFPEDRLSRKKRHNT